MTQTGCFIKTLKQNVFKVLFMVFLPLILVICPFFSFTPPVHADSTLDRIVSDLGITDTRQLNLLGSDFGEVSDQLGCENDFLDLVANRKLSAKVFSSCNNQISSIVMILAPYIEVQQHISLPSLFLPFGLGPSPAEAIIYGIYATNLGQSLMGLIGSAVNILGCREYIAALSEAEPLDPIIMAEAVVGELASPLFIGMALACEDITSSILTLIAPIAIYFHPTVLGSRQTTTI